MWLILLILWKNAIETSTEQSTEITTTEKSTTDNTTTNSSTTNPAETTTKPTGNYN